MQLNRKALFFLFKKDETLTRVIEREGKENDDGTTLALHTPYCGMH